MYIHIGAGRPAALASPGGRRRDGPLPRVAGAAHPGLIYTYIYIYIQREREREVYVYMYIYIYIHRERKICGMARPGLATKTYIYIYIYVHVCWGARALLRRPSRPLTIIIHPVSHNNTPSLTPSPNNTRHESHPLKFQRLITHDIHKNHKHNHTHNHNHNSTNDHNNNTHNIKNGVLSARCPPYSPRTT